MRCVSLQIQVTFIGESSYLRFQKIILSAQRRWIMIEKEALLIMESLDKLRHFVLSDNHFRLFTDQRNLIFLFDPTLKESGFKKQTVDKLCQWASKIQGCSYIIESLPGEDNLWADMLSRWITNPSKARTTALRPPTAPLMERAFSWRSILEIQVCREQPPPGNLELTSSDGVLMFMDKVWVPDANNLSLRICSVGHGGIAGHPSFEGTKRRISEFFL